MRLYHIRLYDVIQYYLYHIIERHDSLGQWMQTGMRAARAARCDDA